MQDLFLAGEYVNFYKKTSATLQETSFRVKPKIAENRAFAEHVNGILGSLHQHMELQQYKDEKFIPEVSEFNTATGEFRLTFPADLTTAVPTLLLKHNDIFIDQRNAAWITKQAFQLASMASEAGIALPFSVENFLVCYKSEVFALLDWTTTQLYTNRQMDAAVAQQQVVDLANLLISVVDYKGAASDEAEKNSRLWNFMQEATDGVFLSVADATLALDSILT